MHKYSKINALLWKKSDSVLSLTAVSLKFRLKTLVNVSPGLVVNIDLSKILILRENLNFQIAAY